MIFGFVALLIAGLAFWFYKQGNAMLTTPPPSALVTGIDVTPNSSGVASGDTIYGPRATVVNGVATGPANMRTGTEQFTQSGYDRFIANASAYNPNDPATAARTADAADRARAASALSAITAANAQAHLTQAVGSGFIPTNGPVSNYQPGTSVNIGDTPVNPFGAGNAGKWDSATQTWITVKEAPIVGPMQIA